MFEAVMILALLDGGVINVKHKIPFKTHDECMQMVLQEAAVVATIYHQEHGVRAYSVACQPMGEPA